MLALRLEPPIEVDTPKGRGWAILFRDYGFDHDDLWTVLISETKEYWTFCNPEIRGVDNATFGVGCKTTPKSSSSLTPQMRQRLAGELPKSNYDNVKTTPSGERQY